jgi:signal transduction histidine kinase/ligand-binding sensor domain-containing protein/DNA-binding response OmpR family regulator
MRIYTNTFFFFIFLLLLSSVAFSQSEEFRFEHISTSDGLSSNSINDILQDTRGFIWFATDLGLHRWDGYKMKLFYHEPNDTNSLSSSAINTIYEDSDSILWIGTYYHGLNRFNRNLETFTRYDIGNANPDANNQNIIFAMNEDRNNNLWIGTEFGLLKFNRTTGGMYRFVADSTSFKQDVSERAINGISTLCSKDINTLLVGTTNGLVQFDLTKEVFIESPFNKQDLSKYPSNQLKNIRDIYKESSKVFWIATVEHGLYRYEPKRNLVQRYFNELRNLGIIDVPSVTSISASSKGDMWFGTWYGLYKYDRSSDKFNVYLHNSRDASSISSSVIDKIYIDKGDNLWIGTQNRGVSFLPSWQKPYKSFDWDSEDTNSLGYGQVKGICEDHNGDIWIGSWGGGVSHYYAKNIRFDHYTNEALEQKRIFSNYINVIYNDDEDNIWIGSNGLEVLDTKKGSIRSINEVKNRKIKIICEDISGNLWIGFKYSGFARFNKINNSCRYFSHDPNDSLSLSEDRISCLYRDKSGRLWIGTIDGLNRLDNPYNESAQFIRYYNDSTNPNSISDNTITDIYEDSKGRIWVGTRNGLNLFDSKTNQFNISNIIKGSTNNIIQKIVEDDRGNLWIRWGEKLVKYNPDTGEVRVYDEKDGFLPTGQPGRWDEVLYRGRSGIMYYGGVDSFVSFHPDKLKDNPNPPHIVMTDFLLHNKPVDIGKNSTLKQSISEVKIIELTHNENILSFEFAALDYTNPGKNQYAYKMKGVDEEWVYTDASRRYANYTNLDPGEYMFSVKASNSDGVWNEVGTSISIIISPPWWQTWWAYTVYIFLISAILYMLRRYELHRRRLKQELILEQEQTEKLQEIDQMKSRFFANISHEFRTPLTLILGPSENIIRKTTDDDTKKQVGSIKRNADRLLGLINQLLDLSKLESGELKVKASAGNIVSFVKGITMSFESFAERKDITLKVQITNEEIVTYFDKDKMVKILTNLLSNAFKFTAEGGEIIVSIKEVDMNSVVIRVKDTGIGISKEEIPMLFDRFYQVDSSQTRENEGTGIGLAHTKELVELHHGKISVDSKEREWTEFTVELPLGREHLNNDEIVKLIEPMVKETIIDEEEYLSPTTGIQSEISDNIVDDKTIILVVEDNADVREYIKDSLGEEHQIEEAMNGEQGLRKAEEIIPDLIISDIMMPKMDGNELTRLLKNNEKTSHIPVILLTAKSEKESKIEGLETGADDYLTKPFDTLELLVRIKNLIEQRKKLQDKFRKELTINPSDITVTSIDEQLLQRAIDAVENNISDSDFDTSMIAKEVGVSRMLLHTKLKALTGQSTGEFIRTLRLKRAAQLLQQGSGNVTQVAYDVGFQSLSYFAKTFRKQFGQSPSHYTSQDNIN